MPFITYLWVLLYPNRAKTIITLEDAIQVDFSSIPADSSNCDFKGVGYQWWDFSM